MRKKYLLIFPLLLASLVFVPKLYAAPSSNPIFATIDKVQQIITDALTPLNNLLGNHEERIDNLENKVSELEEKINELQITPTPILTPTLTPTPTPIPLEPFDHYFFNGSVNFNTISSVLDTLGYSNIFITVDCPVGVATYYIEASADQQTWNQVMSSGIPGCKNGQNMTTNLSSANRYWRFGIGGGTGTELTFVAKAHLY
jgi:hypothetical protein